MKFKHKDGYSGVLRIEGVGAVRFVGGEVDTDDKSVQQALEKHPRIEGEQSKSGSSRRKSKEESEGSSDSSSERSSGN